MALTPRSIWEILEIAPTRDAGAIRRAYAGRLKVTNPEDDADAFQALRQAYDQAMGLARQRPRPAPPPAAADTPRTDLTPSSSTPEPDAPAPSPPQLFGAPVDETAHAALCNALAERIWAQDGDPDGDAMQAALEAVLSSPAMDSVAVYSRTEIWLSRALAESAPNSDPLIHRAITFFRWDDDSRPGAIGAAALERRQDLLLLQVLRGRTHLRREAFEALSRKPRRTLTLKLLFKLGFESRVYSLLGELRHGHPGLISSLNPAALEFWDQRSTRPRYGAIGTWTLLFLTYVLGLGLSTVGTPTNGPAPNLALCCLGSFAVVLLAQLIWLYGPARAKARLQAPGAGPVSDWVRFGWAPLSLALVVGAGMLPTSTGAAVAILLLGFAAYVWSYIVSEPETRHPAGPPWAMPTHLSLLSLTFFFLQPIWRPDTQMPWQLRAAFAYFYLGVFMALTNGMLETAVAIRVDIAIAFAALTFAGAAGSLADLWTDRLSPAVRRSSLLGIGLLGAAPPVMFWWSAAHREWTLPAILLTAVIVLIHKTPATYLERPVARWRDRAMRYGWFSWMLLAQNEGVRQVNGAGLFGSLWLLTGVAITVWGALRLDAPARARRHA